MKNIMRYDYEYGVYIAEEEDLETFCKMLINKRNSRKRRVIGEYKQESIYVDFGDTVTTLVDKYNKQVEKEKKNPHKRRTTNHLTRNASGYYDPTAYLAIKHLEAEMEDKKNVGK